MSEIVGLDDGKLLRSDYVYDTTQGKKQSEINQNVQELNKEYKIAIVSRTVTTDANGNQALSLPTGYIPIRAHDSAKVNTIIIPYFYNGYYYVHCTSWDGNTAKGSTSITINIVCIYK